MLATGPVPEPLATVWMKKTPISAVPRMVPKPARPPPGHETFGWLAVHKPPDVTVTVRLARNGNAICTIGAAFVTDSVSAVVANAPAGITSDVIG